MVNISARPLPSPTQASLAAAGSSGITARVRAGVPKTGEEPDDEEPGGDDDANHRTFGHSM